MSSVDLHGQPGYEPTGHQGVVNRLLAGRELGIDEVSVWHGTLRPRGGSDRHVHEGCAQVYVGLSGTCSVEVDDAEFTLAPMVAVTVPAGRPHRITNTGDGDATLLVISAPALR